MDEKLTEKIVQEVHQLLIDSVKDYAIILLDPEGRVNLWSAGAEKISGYSEKEIIGKHISIFYPREAVNAGYPDYELKKAKETGRFEDEGWRIKKDGSRYWANVIISPVYDQGQHLGFSKVTRDLTERKKVENDLKRSDERYKLLISRVRDYAIFMLDGEGNIATWNEGARYITGYKEGEILGRSFSIFYTEKGKEENFAAEDLARVKRVGSSETEGLRVRKDGTVFYSNTVITALFNDSNELVGFSFIMRDLTERKETEEELRANEERYRLLVEGVRDYAIFMLDPNGYITTWNEGAKRLKGYTEREIIGKHFSIFYPQEAKDTKYPDYELEQAKKLGRFQDEGLRVRKDGSTFFANVVITAIYNHKKVLIGFSKITRDLTERKEYEEVLRQSEERYRLLIEGVRDYAIFMLDPDGNIATWNEGAKRLKGYSASDIIGRHFSNFYPQEAKDRKYPDYELEQAKKTGRYEDEGWRVRKDGSMFYANVVITAIYNHQKNLMGFTKITRDLTDKREAEEALRLSEERYRLLIEGVRDYAIFMLDPGGHIATWNEGAKRLKGYTYNEIIGRHFSIFYPEELVKRNYPDYELEQAKKNGRYEDEGYRVRKDGSRFYANVIITALHNKSGELIGFSKITRDLTERKEAEKRMQELNSALENKVEERTQELSKSLAELKRINSDLDSFIYTASHDLKAPVSNIEGLVYTLSDLLAEQQIPKDEVENVISLMKQSIVRFQGTIKDLTEINISQKNVAEDQVSLNISQVVEDVKISIANLIQNSNTEIKLNTSQCPEIRFSRRHLNSIFYNLITNAIKYKALDRAPIIYISSYYEGKYAVISVRDNGLGIKEQDKEKIFYMFKRLHDHVDGTGVGLYIVKRIIDNAGGKIEVDSKLGEGTTFRICLLVH